MKNDFYFGFLFSKNSYLRIACIEKIVKGEADFMPLEPEEIYVANRFQPDGFIIISEIRSEEFAERDFRYEPVAVIRNSAGISSVKDLKGKRSCHTGYGRNAGWKVPFSHLMDKGELPPFCDEINAPTPEKDLNAVSQYFGAACAPGAWVPEKEIDKKLKETYPKLCELCKDPKACAKDDNYSNYDGALRCLTENGGDVAWTKMDAVEKFFKLKDSTPKEIVKEYSLLCWDGSSMPITSPNPCSWAKRPWKAVVASSRLGGNPSQVKDLQDQLTTFRTIAQEQGKLTNIVPEWNSAVLEFQKISDVEFNYEPHRAKTVTPSIYLSQRNFTVTIEKPSCATKKTVKFCVRSEVEKQKCTALRMAAMGQRILPGFTCVLGEGSRDCTDKVAKGEADVVVLSAKEADRAQRNMKLVSILSEVEETDVDKRDQSAPYRYAVAVVRTEVAGDFHGNISSLRGKRSCHGSVRSVAGWNAPLTVLRRAGELTGPICGLTIELSRYFNNQSCVPGAMDPELRMPWLPKSLCSLCAGDGDVPGKPETAETLCQDSDSERYHGDLGALRCLQDGVADVAFLDHVGLHSKTIGSELEPSLNRMKLLCPNGSITELQRFSTCNWGRVSSQKVLARGGEENLVDREDARISLLKAQDVFRPGGKNEHVLRLFGPYFGNKNLLFQDTSLGLCDELDAVEREPQDKLIRDFDYCTTSAGISPHHFGGLVSTTVMIVVASKVLFKF